jgi:hypothetical protein
MKIRVGITKSTISVMRRLAWKRLRPNAAAGDDQGQRDQNHS